MPHAQRDSTVVLIVARASGRNDCVFSPRAAQFFQQRIGEGVGVCFLRNVDAAGCNPSERRMRLVLDTICWYIQRVSATYSYRVPLCGSCIFETLDDIDCVEQSCPATCTLVVIVEIVVVLVLLLSLCSANCSSQKKSKRVVG